MNRKWSYNVSSDTHDTSNTNISNNTNPSTNPTTDNNLLFPDDTTQFFANFSTTAQHNSTTTSDVEENPSPLSKKQSITDSQGIDVAEDANVVVKEIENKFEKLSAKDQEIIKLKTYITQMEVDRQEILDENSRLKARVSELKKTLKFSAN